MGSHLGIEWREENGELKAFCRNLEVVWAAQPGAQDAFLRCPVFEVLLEGNRGGGKTDALVMDFAQHCGKGFGPDWRGIIFRQTYKQLDDVVAKTKKWIPRIFPGATLNMSAMHWDWPGGERLVMSYMEREQDYWKYHGHAYPWVGWEELTTWPTDRCYKVMMSCCRSARAGVVGADGKYLRMPRRYRATTNPYGVGHNWVKKRFGLPVSPGKRCGEIIEDRVAVHCSLTENQVLLAAEPEYKKRVEEAARNPSEKAAWVEGSWDIVAGGMFDDVWSPAHSIVARPFQIPRAWRINRSYDHGQTRPFSVGWWAESNGEPADGYGQVKGDLFRIREWYGWCGQDNEGLKMASAAIGRGILEREARWGIRDRVRPGPADSSIFDDFEPGKSVAGEMEREGVRWERADKGPGSRKQGWQRMREMMINAVPGAEGTRERPGLFIFPVCDQFIRTVPVLPRDDKDLDDVDTDAEDHIGDESRYRTRQHAPAVACRNF